MARKKRDEYETAYKDYKAGLSLDQVADRLVVSRQCVYSAFKRRGYQLRGKNYKIPSTAITENGLVVGLGFRKIVHDETRHVYEYGYNLGRMLIQISGDFKSKEFWFWSECIQLECETLQDLETIIRVLNISDGKEETESNPG